MGRSLEHRDWVGRGIECPNCHTVYFVEEGQNRDRIYHRDGKSHHLPVLSPVGSIRSLQTRQWTLLCICSEQISFQKDEIRRYVACQAALDLGYATKGQWKRLSEVQWKRLSGILNTFADALGLSTREFFQISEFLQESNAAEKRRH